MGVVRSFLSLNFYHALLVTVDGASDEGPGHKEVQYWWTVRHIEKKKLATLITTRSSGSSYLNRVELQNGCLSFKRLYTINVGWIMHGPTYRTCKQRATLQ